MLSYEIAILLTATLLGLAHLSVASFTFKAQVGNKYSVGPRDVDMEKVGADPRMQPEVFPMPFDDTRMLYGGFEMVVES